MSWGLVERECLVSRKHTCLQSVAGVALRDAAFVKQSSLSCSWKRHPVPGTIGQRFLQMSSDKVRAAILCC